MKIFWDTNLFIYLWEEKPPLKDWDEMIQEMEHHQLATSTLTMGEILVHPFQHGRSETALAYRQALDRLALIPFDAEAAVCFARLRATHPSLRPPDAIQLACAVTGGCEIFFTNDRRLLDVEAGIRILAIQDWNKI